MTKLYYLWHGYVTLIYNICKERRGRERGKTETRGRDGGGETEEEEATLATTT